MIWHIVGAVAGIACLALGFYIGRRFREERTTLPSPEPRREPVWAAHETEDVIRDLIRQRDRYQRQAIDLQLATNGLLAEREELFRALRRRAN